MTPRRTAPAALLAAVLSAIGGWCFVPTTADARDLTRQQRAELAGLSRDAGRLAGLIRRGKTDDARELLAETDAKFAALKQAAGAAIAGRSADRVIERLAEARAQLAPAADPTADPPPPAGVTDEAAMTESADPPAMMRRTGAPEDGVLFSRDVAPTLVNVCGGCHMNGQSRGGFSMNTFEELIESGYVDPDDPEGGRMARLMGQIEQPKMPPGNVFLKRSQWENARDWATAGAELDRGNPKDPLRELVPTEAQLKRAAMAALDDAGLFAARRERAEELFKLARPRETPAVLEVPADAGGGAGGFVFVGNVDGSRLKQLAGWAAEDAARLAPLLGGEPLGGRGPLTVAVMKDRFDYEEFHLGVRKRPAPPGLTSDASVPDDGSDAYVVLQDLRDDPTRDDIGMRANLIAGLAAAAVEGGDGDVPAWLAAGLGPSVARRADPRNPALAAMNDTLAAALRRVRKGDDLLTPGTFAPAELPAVGAAVADVLRKNGGDRKLAEFLAAVRRTGTGDGGAAALRAVYRTTPAQLAAALAAETRRR